MAGPGDAPTVTLHATTIALDGRAALIRGASGRGKSALALQLIALGAVLVADDRTLVTREGTRLIARAPNAIAGRIEARGVGILAAPTVPEADIELLIDLDRDEPARLPDTKTGKILGLSRPELGNIGAGHFPAAILLYLRHGRIA